MPHAAGYGGYSGGSAVDFFCHRLAPLGLMTGRQFPRRVSGHRGIDIHRDREVPDTYATVIDRSPGARPDRRDLGSVRQSGTVTECCSAA